MIIKSVAILVLFGAHHFECTELEGEVLRVKRDARSDRKDARAAAKAFAATAKEEAKAARGAKKTSRADKMAADKAARAARKAARHGTPVIDTSLRLTAFNAPQDVSFKQVTGYTDNMRAYSNYPETFHTMPSIWDNDETVFVQLPIYIPHMKDITASYSPNIDGRICLWAIVGPWAGYSGDIHTVYVDAGWTLLSETVTMETEYGTSVKPTVIVCKTLHSADYTSDDVTISFPDTTLPEAMFGGFVGGIILEEGDFDDDYTDYTTEMTTLPTSPPGSPLDPTTFPAFDPTDCSDGFRQVNWGYRDMEMGEVMYNNVTDYDDIRNYCEEYLSEVKGCIGFSYSEGMSDGVIFTYIKGATSRQDSSDPVYLRCNMVGNPEWKDLADNQDGEYVCLAHAGRFLWPQCGPMKETIEVHGFDDKCMTTDCVGPTTPLLISGNQFSVHTDGGWVKGGPMAVYTYNLDTDSTASYFGDEWPILYAIEFSGHNKTEGVIISNDFGGPVVTIGPKNALDEHFILADGKPLYQFAGDINHTEANGMIHGASADWTQVLLPCSC